MRQGKSKEKTQRNRSWAKSRKVQGNSGQIQNGRKSSTNAKERKGRVRSNYFNNYLNIKEDNSYLIKFYENLLLGKNNNLHSKDLIVEELFDKK